MPRLAQALALRAAVRQRGVPRPLLEGLRWLAQQRAEQHNREVRMQNLKQDRQIAKLLSFSGRGE